MAKPTSALDRFASSHVVNAVTGCWEWTGTRDENGYGRFRVNGKTTSVHRWSYEHHIGPIPEGLHIDHLCRFPPCVNPEHLEPVTPRENIMRSPIAPTAVNARKTECDGGHPLSGANLYVRSDGERTCRECQRAYFRKHKAQRPLPAGIARYEAKRQARRKAERAAARAERERNRRN